MIETVTLSHAKELIRTLAATESLLLLSAPGVGKTDIVRQAAADSGLECRSLLGTQIAPEDVSGVPCIVGERAVFCPPRLLLPTDGRPYCLFLDELPAAPTEVQKAFYSLLLERRLGEHALPQGTWVVAAGNRTQDRAIANLLSSALINRVFVLTVRVNVQEWLKWAERAEVRQEIVSFISIMPVALNRGVPREPVPFSTPRSWALLSRDLDLAEREMEEVTGEKRRALAFGRVSPQDAGMFCALVEDGLNKLHALPDYLRDPGLLPDSETARWFVVSRFRQAIIRGDYRNWRALWPRDELAPRVNGFIRALPQEFRFALVCDQIPIWSHLGGEDALREMLADVTGL